jgi:hypothetical protein
MGNIEAIFDPGKGSDDCQIAFLIPETEERLWFAQLFKVCMEMLGFALRQFSDNESAEAWLSRRT